MISAPIVIADYNPRWPAMYQEEMVSIIGAMGHRLVAIEHVGSTSVPGLAAKPIIDIMAAIDSLDNAQECIGPLKDLGYEYIPEYEDVRPERRYFHKGPAAARTHHLHVVELHSAFWSRHILFRDYLRTHPEEASRYVQLKRELAARYGADRLGYQDAKGPYITLVEEKARVASEINLLRRSP